MRFDPHNCLLFVIDQWLQHPEGYVIIRRSDSGWFPHFLFSRNLVDFWEYLPKERLSYWWVKFLPPPFYRGMVRHTTAANLKRREMPLRYTDGIEIPPKKFRGYN